LRLARLRIAAHRVRFLRAREQIAARHLRGAGLEIGALHLPLGVPAGVIVRYVDGWTATQLRAQYPELADWRIVETDILDDATRLATIPDASQDFVIANHFLEHAEDPIGALGVMLRVTRPGGIVFLVVPDKRHSFDHRRPVTTLEHLARDHAEGPEWSRAAHYAEFARLVEGVDEADLDAHVAAKLDEHPHIHFHVFTYATLVGFLAATSPELGFEIVETTRRRYESIVVLRRSRRLLPVPGGAEEVSRAEAEHAGEHRAEPGDEARREQR
jgi:predicted SAM-dependent methyltransferase